MGCGAEALTIVSMLSVPSVFFRPPDRAEESGGATVPDAKYCLQQIHIMHVQPQTVCHGCEVLPVRRHTMFYAAFQSVCCGNLLVVLYGCLCYVAACAVASAFEICHGFHGL
jgi:hypothetical protein